MTKQDQQFEKDYVAGFICLPSWLLTVVIIVSVNWQKKKHQKNSGMVNRGSKGLGLIWLFKFYLWIMYAKICLFSMSCLSSLTKKSCLVFDLRP